MNIDITAFESFISTLRRLCNAATPGPWEWYNGCSWWRLGIANDQLKHDAVIKPYTAKDGVPDLSASSDDRRFIEAARTSLPEALDKIELLLRANKELTEQYQGLKEKFDRDSKALLKLGMQLSDVKLSLEPVMSWYQPDDQHNRPLNEIVTDVVKDLQDDRKENLELRKIKRAVEARLAQGSASEYAYQSWKNILAGLDPDMEKINEEKR